MRDLDDLFREHAAPLYRAALRAVSRTNIAEDIASQSLLALFPHREEIPPEAQSAWLLADARKRAIAFWHAHPEQRTWSALPTQPAAPSSLEALFAQCDGLKPVHHVCLILRFRHQMPRAEIARHMGFSDLEVKGLLHHALQQAQKCLSPGSADADPEVLLAANAHPGACSAPDLLFAATEHVLPEPLGLNVRTHIEACKLCQTLLAGLAPADKDLAPELYLRLQARLAAEVDALQPHQPVAAARRPSAWDYAPLILILLLVLGSFIVFRWLHAR